MATKIKKKYTDRQYKCLYCEKRYNRVDLVSHINEAHEDEIPEGYSSTRVVYDYINKKPLGYNGKCTECGGPTRWDENKARYDRQCSKKACHESYIKRFEENMMRRKGVKRISQTEEGQKKMLANRKISGYYTFRDGVKKPYCGTYELKALEFMDKVMEINSADILCPGPILEYTFEGKTHMYITDFYYQPYNLVIEVKDGGSNPNNRNMPEYRAKQIAKEQYIIKNTTYNYIRLTDNKLNQLLYVFADIKMQLLDNSNERVIHVNENSCLKEFMGMASTVPVQGLENSEAYVVNYMQNNVFANGPKEKFAITPNKALTPLIAIDKDGIVSRLDKLDLDGYSIGLYKSKKNKEELESIFKDKLGTYMSESEFYELVTGDSLLFEGQINKTLEKVLSSKDEADIMYECVMKYINTSDEDKEISSIIEEIGVLENGQI